MTKDRKPSNEGYRPEYVEKGYRPSKAPSEDGKGPAQGGYQPEKGRGDNPANNPPGKD
ncbi:hypothetical protein ACW7G2_10770 [Luteimonas sp. A277]